MKNVENRIKFEDIRWLRRAAAKSGSESVPPAIAQRLMSAGLVVAGPRPSSVKLTEKGRIALSKLG